MNDSNRKSPKEILDLCFAKGEIEKEEYVERLKALPL